MFQNSLQGHRACRDSTLTKHVFRTPLLLLASQIFAIQLEQERPDQRAAPPQTLLSGGASPSASHSRYLQLRNALAQRTLRAPPAEAGSFREVREVSDRMLRKLLQV